MEEEFLHAAQNMPRQVFEKERTRESSTSRDKDGHVVRTTYKLDGADMEGSQESASTAYSSSCHTE